MNYHENGQKIFILGATGFVGKNLLNHFTKQKYQNVFTVGRYNTDIELDLKKAEFSQLVAKISPNDTFVFLAAISSPDQCQNDFENAYTINVTNTKKLIDILILNGVRVIFASSDAVYGNVKNVCYDNSPLAPIGKYGEMKAEVEQAFSNCKLVKVIRFSYILGNGDNYSTLLFNKQKNNQTVQVFSGFERSIVALFDVIAGIEQLVNKFDQFEAHQINFSGPNIESRASIALEIKLNLYPNLHFEVIDPPENFWEGRAKTIHTKSKLFESLLGNPPMGLKDIIKNWS